MSAPQDNPTTTSPGQLALNVMGWLELAISVVLLILDVPWAAIAFAVAALFLTVLSIQLRKQRLEYLRRTGRASVAAPAAPTRPGVVFWAQLVLGATLVVASAVFTVLGSYALAANFVLWGLTLGLFARRAAQVAGA